MEVDAFSGVASSVDLIACSIFITLAKLAASAPHQIDDGLNPKLVLRGGVLRRRLDGLQYLHHLGKTGRLCTTPD
jgi:hypothetical protein